MNFALPVCRSSFSLLHGTATPENLVKAANENNYRVIILADRSNLYGCYDFYYAARETGLKPIIGAEVATETGNLLLICRSHDGFKNLSKIITYYQLHGALSANTLNDNRGDIICIVENDSSVNIPKEIFGSSLYMKISYEKPSHAIRLAKQNSIKPIACPDVHFLRHNDFEKHCLLKAIDGGYLLANIPKTKVANKGDYLRGREWYDNYFSPFPEAIGNSQEIIERCNLIFPERRNILPDIEIKGDHFEKLKNDALEGLRGKLPNLSGCYLSRLEYELSVIHRTGFVDYFLIVGEIINFCRQENITAVGRGSAAGSLVSYSLGITQVDPIKQELYFERFLNEARSDCPDIDLDIDWRRRDDVLDYIYKKYGNENVAMIASYIHFQPRLAIRETAKAMGFAPEEIDKLTKCISSYPLERYDFSQGAVNNLKNFDRRFAPVLRAAKSIYGLPRHLGIHPGGIVITPEPLTNYIPLERATKGIVVTQCDMYQAEKIGLVKIDILGQRGLAVIVDCLNAVRQIKGKKFKIPGKDPKTYKTLRTGKTIGVFQIESPGMRALLKDLQPQQLNDIILGLALIRPGASESGMKKVFLNRFHGKEKTAYPHHNLEGILKETHGIFIYQEQVILAAQKIAGFNLPASDLLRRAITKKRKNTDKKKLQTRFLDGARRIGVDNKTARNILSQLTQFASFGFCKAHAATYGYLAWQSAYFKTHYPAIFMTAVLQNGGGYYPSAVYVAEARRLGIKVLPPDINISKPIDSLQNNHIYLGIDRIKDISRNTIEQIQNNRPFNSMTDFLSRVDLSVREMENLIRVGFFDSLETSRPKLLWQYRLSGSRKHKKVNDLFGDRITPPKMECLPRLEQFSRFEIFKAENSIIEIPASFHPLSMFNNCKNISFEMICRKKHGARITTSGWLADRKRSKTKDGKSMVFLTFDSPEDTFEVVLFPDIYNRYNNIIRKYRYLTIEGYVNIECGNTAIIAEKITLCPTGLKEVEYI